jgi:hypothetical protein
MKRAIAAALAVAACDAPGWEPAERRAPPAGEAGAAEAGEPPPGSQAGSVPGEPLAGAARPAPPPPQVHADTPELDWDGWSLHPVLPPGCRGLWVPDDPARRIPPVEWEACPDREACQRMKIEWDPTKAMPFSMSAWGTAPDHLLVNRVYGHTNQAVLYGGDQVPRAAWRTDSEEQAGMHHEHTTSLDGTLAATRIFWFKSCRADLQDVILTAPAAEPGPLMWSPTPALAVPADFLHGRFFQDFVVSPKIMAASLTSTVAIGDLATKQLVDVAPPPGDFCEFHAAAAVERDAFMIRWCGETADLWVSRDGAPAEPFIQVPGGYIPGLATNGSVMVWSEATDPQAPSPDMNHARVEVFMAPYANRASEVKKQSIGLIPDWLGDPVIANGHVLGGRWLDGGHRRQFLYRMSDGAWFELELPAGWRFEFKGFPTASELWIVMSMKQQPPAPTYHKSIVRLAIDSLKRL